MIALLNPLWLSVLALHAQPAAPAIFKCTDPRGEVTYQQERCPSSGKSATVDLQETGRGFDLPEREAEWRRAAQDHRVVTGMPRRWVREALGTPLATHLGAVAGATETWDYRRDDKPLLLGFRDGNVLWIRESVADRPAVAKAQPPTVAASPAESPERKPRAAERRQAVSLGQDCAAVRADLGAPDEETGAPAGSALSLLPGGDAKEFRYDPAPGDEGVRTRIRCSAGKVTGIDRAHVLAPPPGDAAAPR